VPQLVALLRHGDAGRERVGRCDGQRLRRQVRPREEPRVLGRHREAPREHAALPGDGGREGRRPARGLEQHPAQGQPEVRQERGAHRPRLERRDRPHRLVRPDVPDEAVSAAQDVAGPEGQGEHLQEPGVGVAGDVPRRGPVVRPEGPAADQAARTEPQVRVRRRGAGAGRPLEPGVQAEEADSLLLVHAAVPEHGVPAVRDQAPGAEQEVRRLVQPEAREQLDHLPVRVRADDHREGDHVEVRQVGLARRRRLRAGHGSPAR